MEEISLDKQIELLETYRKYLSEDQISRLVKLLQDTAPSRELTVDASGKDIMDSLMVEVQAQMTYLQKFRQQVTSQSLSQTTTRQIKDMVQSTKDVYSMLLKMNQDIVNQDRLRKVEIAVTEAVKSLDTKTQEAFLVRLEELLA